MELNSTTNMNGIGNEYKNKNFNAFYILWFYYLFPDQKHELKNIKEPFTAALMYDLRLNISLEINHIFASQILLFSSYNAKFNIIQYVSDHMFISPIQKKSFLNLFCAIQKIYSWLNRIVYLRKLKNTVVAVDTDLYYNTLSLSKSYVFPLHQLNTVFYFSISDIMNIIKCALFQSWEDNFIVISKMPQNPYNKQYLGKHHLYNLYFHMKYKMNCVIPIYFHTWFLEDFDLSKYTKKYETMLRKLCICQFTKNAQNTNKIVAEDILDMLDEYRYICSWEIDSSFPATVLVDKFRSYLYLYYLLNYNALESSIYEQCETILEVGLKKCYEQNPLFGQKILLEEKKTNSFEWGKKLLNKYEVVSNKLFHTDVIPISSWNF